MTEAAMADARSGRARDPESTVRALYSQASYPGFICPDYDGYCITNIAPLILSSFGLPGEPPAAIAPLVPRSYRHVVLLIIDAMGYRLMQRCAADIPALARVAGAGA